MGNPLATGLGGGTADSAERLCAPESGGATRRSAHDLNGPVTCVLGLVADGTQSNWSYGSITHREGIRVWALAGVGGLVRRGPVHTHVDCGRAC